jgi:carbon starvation protein CstA
MKRRSLVRISPPLLCGHVKKKKNSKIILILTGSISGGRQFSNFLMKSEIVWRNTEKEKKEKSPSVQVLLVGVWLGRLLSEALCFAKIYGLCGCFHSWRMGHLFNLFPTVFFFPFYLLLQYLDCLHTFVRIAHSICVFLILYFSLFSLPYWVGKRKRKKQMHIILGSSNP